MFLKQEKSEMDKFERQNNWFYRGKTLNKKKKSFKLIPLQKCKKIYLHNLLFHNILIFFFYVEKKKLSFLAVAGGGDRPPPSS